MVQGNLLVQRIPTDVWANVFSKMSTEDMMRLRCVNTYFHKLLDDSHVWKLCHLINTDTLGKEFKKNPPDNLDWKEICIQREKLMHNAFKKKKPDPTFKIFDSM
eukprot:TRINITY_DN2820_c0_g1_i2.p1 TRINITY_DN2820_c0_g1~~TRINITY_DN2820_c0_g1_i2.p1  ORF type:complete len:104 (+),score=16.33 TRINITY_DN2820_c0_g1_i2:48-359(+)